MKKLLTILGAVGLMATTGATVVACGTKEDPKAKGDFPITVKDTKIVRGTTATVEITGFADLKYEEYKVIIDEKGKDLIEASEVDKEGKVTVTGIKAGTAKLHIEANVKAETFAEEPVKVISNVLEFTVEAPKLQEIFKEEIDLGTQTDETAKTAVEGKIEAKEGFLAEWVTVGDAANGKVKVTVAEAGKGYVDGEVTFTYTAPAK